MKLSFWLAATALAAFATLTFAQDEGETPIEPERAPITTSQLAGVRLPANAKTMKNQADVAPTVEAMQPLLAVAGVSLREPEFLVWERPNYRRDQAAKITAQMAQSLKVAGYAYQQAAPIALDTSQFVVMMAGQ